MKIGFIDLNGDYSTYVTRLLSAILKRENHDVSLIFMLPRPDPDGRETEQLSAVLDDVDLVMISVFSPIVYRARQVTEFVHRKYPGLKVIWGGAHCIAAPEKSLDFADGVCYSEGDQAIVELVKCMEAGEDYHNIRNMAFRVNDTIQVNELFPPLTILTAFLTLTSALKISFFLMENYFL
ncbi:MAG: cobalamin-dependent protein [Candidatus Electryonea clarkiae]|nr:cobalamin-dependent protein [Candidatus Electryonea clarkiae]MDP8287122.1 cobalamin-dependent protein [Candidatus Electryonea clarkiae]